MEEQQIESEQRKSGWILQCKTCGWSRPYRRYGIWIGAPTKGQCKMGYCKRCQRLRCHAVRKR